MNRLSSKWTLVSKRIFPVVWIAFLVAFAIPLIFATRSGTPLDPVMFIAPIIASVIVFFVMNVSYTMFGNNRRATLRLRTGCRFGSEVAFMPVAPAWRLTFFKNPILEELIERIDAARRRKP